MLSAALARVRNRVVEGGHAVPEDVVRQRFEAGWRNFREVYMDLVDEWAFTRGSLTKCTTDTAFLYAAMAVVR